MSFVACSAAEHDLRHPANLPKSLSTLNVSNNNILPGQRLDAPRSRDAPGVPLQAQGPGRHPRPGTAPPRRASTSKNKIDGDPEEMVRLRSVPKLACLYLQGNPIVTLRQYRKRMISEIPGLAYLDDDLSPLERLCAEAWAKAVWTPRRRRKEYKDARRRNSAAPRVPHRGCEAAGQSARHSQNRQESGRPRHLGRQRRRVGTRTELPELVAARERLARYEARPGEEEPRS